MNSIFLVVSAVGATAAIFVLNLLTYIFRKWMEMRRLKCRGIEATARILEARVINDKDRYLPFVRLKLEVNPPDQNSFETEADSFFAIPELISLAAGNFIRIRYNTDDTTQVQIIKRPALSTTQETHSWQPVTENAQLVLAS